MPLPKPIAPQTLAGLKTGKNSPSDIYETSKAVIDAHNQLIHSLGPGDPIGVNHFNASTDVTVNQASGTVKRGRLTAKIGTGAGANSTIRMQFPAGAFKSQPFAQIIRNGGNGASPYTYTETDSGFTITLASPVEGEEYGFRFAVQE